MTGTMVGLRRWCVAMLCVLGACGPEAPEDVLRAALQRAARSRSSWSGGGAVGFVGEARLSVNLSVAMGRRGRHAGRGVAPEVEARTLVVLRWLGWRRRRVPGQWWH